MSRIGSSKGFTLVEVMVTAAILSISAVLIYQTFFSILDIFNYCSDYLAIAPWMDEKIWLVQDYLRRLGPEAVIETEGAVSGNNKTFNWGLTYGVIGVNDKRILYGVELDTVLARGANKVRLSRSAYAMYQYEKKE